MPRILDIYPLSPIQQGILFHCLFSPESGVYMVQTHCVLHPSPDVSAFERAWNETVRRHDIFRTAFEWQDLDDAIQVVYDHAEVSLTQLDWRGQPPAEQRERLQEYLIAERKRDFDFSKPPLMRLALIKLDDESSQFIWTIHHLLIDTWSEALLFAEISAFYNAFCQGKSIPTDPAPAYRDYIKWIQQQDLSEADAFWRRLLEGFQSPTVLGEKRTLQSKAEQAFESQQVTLSTETTHALQPLARRHEVTLNTLTQGAWALLLSHYSQENDIVFGVTVSGRPFSLPGAEFIIGPFLNMLPMRVQLDPNVTLPDWLRNLQAQSADSRQFEYSPLIRVQGLSDVQGGLPLFESIYVFHSAPVNLLRREKESANGKLAIRDLQTVQNSNYPLCVIVGPGGQLSLQIIYDSSAFAPATIARMLKHLRNLLEGMIAHPTGRLFDLPLLSATERREILVEWNDTKIEFPRHFTFPEMFEVQVEKTPDSPALRFEGTELTYRELNRRANQLANYLRERGVGPEEKVGVMMDRSVDMVVSMLGVLKAGGAYVPLDVSYPEERLRYMIEDAGAKLVVTNQESEERIRIEGLRKVQLEQEWAQIGGKKEGNSEIKVMGENLAYVIYTSGSTGRPKGVMIQHQSLVNLVHWHQRTYEIGPGDRATQASAPAFDASVWEIWPYLASGASVEIVPDRVRLSAVEMLRWLEQKKITIGFLVTPVAELVMAECQQNEYRNLRLRALLTGGDKLRQVSAGLPFAVLNHYGPTENTVVATWAEVSAGTGDAPPIGHAISNAKVYILNQHLGPVPVRVKGEIYIAGVGLARGYVNHADMTAERFVPDPFSETGGERLYRTGDVARFLEDGKIEYLGRIDSQVKVRGYRIELGEIEAALRLHKQVREAVVELQQRECETARLVGYVVLNRDGGNRVDMRELRNYLRGQLPEYMVPSTLVLLPELPLTPNGKIDRRALMNTELQEAGWAEGFVAPRSQTEMILAAIWAEVLRRENVGTNDNFFNLGGHSLLAMRLVSKLRESFRVDLSLRTIFAAATLAEMARAVDAALRQNAALEMPPIRRRSPDRQPPLSFAQQRLWLIQHLETESTAYNVCNAVRLRGHLNIEALKKALNEIGRRHEILRTTFTFSGDQLVQVVAPATPLNLEVEDLRMFSAAEQQAEAQRVAMREAQVVFDLETGPLFRLRLLRLNNEHVLTICRHHIIFDGWSHEVFTSEFAALYNAFDREQAPELPELPIQYADFACWERDWLRDDRMKTLLQYWQKQLEGAPVALKLPVDRPLSPASSYRSKWQSFTLDRDQTKTIRALSQTERVSSYMVLLAAFKAFLYRYTGQPDFLIGTPVTSRNQSETELLIGCFLNMLVLRTNLSGNPAFRELLGRVRETVLGAYTHQEMPFDKLVEELKIGRARTSTPLVQVVFSHVKLLQAASKLTGLQITPLEIEDQTGKADWLMLMVEQGEEIVSSLQYRTDLFDDKTISRAMSHFKNLFHCVLKNPDARLDEVEMLSREEQIVLKSEIDISALSRSFSF